MKMVVMELKMPESNLRRFEELRKLLGYKTDAQVLNCTLTILDWVLNQENGKIVAAVDVDGQKYSALVIPTSDQVKGANSPNFFN